MALATLILDCLFVFCFFSGVHSACNNYYPIRDNNDCSLYYVCYQGYTYTYKCNNNYVYSTSSRWCVSRNDWRNNCPTYGNTRTAVLNDQPSQASCGIKLSLQIVGGVQAYAGSWPWIAQISYNGSPFCGGVLISNQWVVTAGHCTYQKSPGSFLITLGEHSLQYYSGDEVSQYVDSVYRPAGFQNYGTYNNDISLIKLRSPVQYTTAIKPVCLPSANDYFSSGDSCWIAGWGETRGTGNSNTLQEMKVQLNDLSFCRNTWGDKITNNHLCVGDGRTGACLGDSGGPMVCMRNSRYVLAGVTSWGHATCNTYGYPSIYQQVRPLLYWIQDTMRYNS